MIDINKLTLGEVAKIEELSGMPISAIGDEDRPKGLAMAALAFIAKRREDPSFSWNAAQNLGLEEANAILGIGTPAGDEEEADQGPLDEEAPAPSKKTRSRS